jgi:inosine-uridine nucleoside N-ribohydrolase
MRRLALLGAVLGFARVAAAGTVWIDTDVSIGSPIREVDDAYALVLAFHSPEIQIAGVSTTYGNAPVVVTTRAAKDLVSRFGGAAGLTADRVFAGARSAHDLGRRSEASDALVKVLEKNSVTYIALGPLTNLATFLQLHPKMARRIERVIFVGGQIERTTLGFGPTRSFRIHDANVFKDPRAAALVLGTKIPLTLAPVATGSELMLDAADLRQLAEKGGAGSYLARRSKVWLWFWTNFVGTKGGPVFDVLGVATTKPGLVSMEKRYARVNEKGDLLVGQKDSRPVEYCGSFAQRTKRVVLQRLMSRPSRD